MIGSHMTHDVRVVESASSQYSFVEGRRQPAVLVLVDHFVRKLTYEYRLK